MISICMAYYNRKQQLFKTLDSINESSIKEYEIIIVDDASEPEHKLDLNELKNRTNGNIILLEVLKENKAWYNSCIAYNISFSRASGDKVIIQNPEIYHMGDILKVVQDQLQDNQYFTFHTIAINKLESEELYLQSNIADVSKYIQPIIRRTVYQVPGETLWYNHKTYRPAQYHFLSAITRDKLYALGGFDERYKDDHSWDDNEFLARINRLGLNKIIMEYPIAVHLNHPLSFSTCPSQGQQNSYLYNQVTVHEKIIKFKELNFNNYKPYLKEVS